MKRSDYSKRYYEAHRSEILVRAKRRREANLELYRERGRKASRCWRERNLELDNKRHIVYFRRWRGSHRKVHRAIRLAQACVPLGFCCEFCGSEVDLMRFHPDYDYPKIVVTVCRECRSFVRKSLSEDERSESERNGID